ncbi:MAG: HAMP domain-containing histidine kinase [Dorea sp.]|nr:HAMP domain-containing histidine kinase [Dorea sp.]
MKMTIKRQVMLTFAGILITLILALLIINGKFLLPFYMADKQQNFVDLYNQLNIEEANGTLTEEDFPSDLLWMTERANVSFLIVGNDKKGMLTNVRDHDVLMNQLVGYSLGNNGIFTEILKETDNYNIYRGSAGRRGAMYLDMVGKLDGGSLFILRSPMESIQESVRISNRFLLYIGGVLIILVLIAAWFFAKRISDPILELASLSEQMANLDFEARYSGKGAKEINELGAHFNEMSQKLENAISELKTANNTLVRDIEKKEEMEQMRTEFLGNVSHELKTPIALIQGYAEGLKEGVSDDPESRAFYCDVIMDEADKMNHLVRNLLTLNQLEFGNDEISIERFDLAELIRGVLQNMVIMNQKEVKVLFDQEEPVYVWADEFKTEQVVTNYVSNAFHHVEGDLVIEVKIIQKPEDGLARVSVFNTGKPIPEADVDHIWDKFYKVDKAHTREYGGNGIGLSIVKAIMKSMHRDYGVINYDNGVEFWFDLDMRNN